MPPKDKKEKPKEKPAGVGFDAIESFILLVIFLSIAGTIVPVIISYVSSGEISFFGFKLAIIIDFFKSYSFFFKFLGFVVAFGAAFGTIFFNKKGDMIWRAEKAKLYPENMPTSFKDSQPAHSPLLEKWQKILAHSESMNPSDWRFAIIEADIILDELLDQLHLPGDTMGDKLKAVEPSDFLTLDSAWEAHKARNQIAHQGSDFLLNQREVRRIISLYGLVFKEFGLI